MNKDFGKEFAGTIGTQFIETFAFIYNQIPDYVIQRGGQVSDNDFRILFTTLLLRVIRMAIPFFLIAFVLVLIVEIAQVGWRPTGKPLQPKGSKLNPVNGVKRLFSKDKLVELLKSIVKIVLISYIAYSTMKDLDMAEGMVEYTTLQVLIQAGNSMLAQANEQPQQALQLLQ